MKNTLIVFSLLIKANFLFCQVQFRDFEIYDDIFSALKKEGKMLHLQMLSNECNQCNDVANSSMNSSFLTDKYNNNFISLRISKDHVLYPELKSKLKNFNDFPHQFISENEIVVDGMNFTTSMPLNYLKYADKAISKHKKALMIDPVEDQYKINPNRENLEKYIVALKELEIFDCNLMDQYVSTLSEDDKAHENIILFVQQHGCDLYSKSYNFTSSIPNTITDKVWYTMPINERIQINNRFRKNSFEKIIQYKDNEKIFRFLRIIRNQHNNSKEGQKLSDQMLVDYYDKTNQVDLYENAQVNFVNRWLDFTSDSLNKEDQKLKLKVFNNSSINSGVSYRPVSNDVATQLNNAAYKIYEKSNNRNHLEYAKEWSQRSIDIIKNCQMCPMSENAAFYDTYAHLLYKLDQVEEALIWQKKAVEVNSTSPLKIEKIVKQYDLMKSRKL